MSTQTDNDPTLNPYISFSVNNSVPRQPGPGSTASSSYSNFRKQTFGGGPSPIGSNNYDNLNPYNGSNAMNLNGSQYQASNFGFLKKSFLKDYSINTSRFLKFNVPVFFKRALKPPTLDLDKAIWEIFYLIFSPKKVYKSLYYHKYTKNHYHRDDPSFIILISAFLIISAVAWGITYNLGFLGILKLILYMVLVDFYLVGMVVATVNWVLANKFLRKSSYLNSLYPMNQGQGMSPNLNTFNNTILNFLQFMVHKVELFFNRNNRLDSSVGSSSDELLEWAYCFDIHANSFLIIWINLYLIQYILLPILVMKNFIGRFLGNTLYLVTFGYYCLNSFYGYNILPFLCKTEFILIPVPLFCILWFVLTISGFNMTNYMVDSYFS